MTEVLIHKYHKNLTAIEFGAKLAEPQNFLIFIGGLGDGFLTVPYINDLASALTENFGAQIVLVQALILSSYKGFGTSSLDRDVGELAKLVEYLRTVRGSSSSKVFLMGHSTGCQDTIHYLSKYSNSKDFTSIQALNGGILQAPVSDSEAIAGNAAAPRFIEMAKELIDQGRPNELLPLEALRILFGAPFSAYRFHSLASKRGDDDYFSSYLTDSDYKKSFGRVQAPILILYGGLDEFVPDFVNRSALVDQWQSNTLPANWSPRSGIIQGATHNLGVGSEVGAVEDVISRVVEFLKDCGI